MGLKDFDVSSSLSGRVFFSYSYKDSEQLKPILRNACERTGFLPVFPDEAIRFGSIAQSIHNLILSCDIVIVICTQQILSNQLLELAYAQGIGKPFAIIAHQKAIQERHFLPAFQDYRVGTYRTSKELLSSVSSALLSSRLTLGKLRYDQERRKDENKIFEVLQKSTEKNILILGKDSDEEGLQEINRIAQVLRNNGYEPVILRELPEILYLSLEDKMIRVGGLCRFVIAEDSRPSGHIDEVRLCASCQYITATIREAGAGSTWMQAHYPLQYSFMNRFCYRNAKSPTALKDNLCPTIHDTLEIAATEAILWAERRINEQEKNLKAIYSGL